MPCPWKNDLWNCKQTTTSFIYFFHFCVNIHNVTNRYSFWRPLFFEVLLKEWISISHWFLIRTYGNHILLYKEISYKINIEIETIEKYHVSIIRNIVSFLTRHLIIVRMANSRLIKYTSIFILVSLFYFPIHNQFWVFRIDMILFQVLILLPLVFLKVDGCFMWKILE